MQRCLQAKTETARASIERKNDLFEAVSHLLNVYSLDFHINTSLKQYFFSYYTYSRNIASKATSTSSDKKKLSMLLTSYCSEAGGMHTFLALVLR